MKGKVLLTGFEPFGEDDVNPSMEIAKSLDGIEVNGYQVVARVLPVEWGTVKDRIETLMDEIQPDVVVSLGLAAGRAELSVEKIAVNYTSKTKDNAGVIPVERTIVAEASDAYFATVPVERIVDELNGKGIPAKVSLSAGGYLCNYAFYCASRYARERGSALVGFIHIPATPKMVAGKPKGGPSMAECLIKDGILQVLTTSTSALTNCG